jgi:hypothetical protein
MQLDTNNVEKTSIEKTSDKTSIQLLQKLPPNKETEINQSPIGDKRKSQRAKKQKPAELDEPKVKRHSRYFEPRTVCMYQWPSGRK